MCQYTVKDVICIDKADIFSYFGAGGALDSQTTDSQFLDALCAVDTQSEDVGEFIQSRYPHCPSYHRAVMKDAAVQTDPVEPTCGSHAGAPEMIFIWHVAH